MRWVLPTHGVLRHTFHSVYVFMLYYICSQVSRISSNVLHLVLNLDGQITTRKSSTCSLLWSLTVPIINQIDDNILITNCDWWLKYWWQTIKDSRSGCEVQPNHIHITMNANHLDLCRFRYIRIVDISYTALLELVFHMNEQEWIEFS